MVSGNLEAHENILSFKAVAEKNVELAKANVHSTEEATKLAQIMLRYPPLSTVWNLPPISVARRTRVVETAIMMMPSAESLPHSPSSAKRRI